MKSMPIIEGLTNDELTTYNTFATQLDDFVATYQSYISACNRNNNTCIGVDASQIRTKLAALNVTLEKYQNVVKSHKETRDTLALNQELINIRAKTQEDTQILTDIENSIQGDQIIKQKSAHYTNAMLYVGLASVLYFTFYQISSAK